MYLRLLIESLRHGRRRKLLAVVTVSLGLLAATSLVEVLVASGDRLAAEMGSYGANLEIRPTGDGETFLVEGLPRLRKIFWRNNIVAVAPLLPLRVRVTPAEQVVALVGTWFDFPLEEGWTTGLPATRPTLEVEGRWPRDGAREVAVGRRLASQLGLAVGDRMAAEVAARRTTLEVVGVVRSGGEEEEQAFAPLARVQGLAGQAEAGARLAGAVPRAEVFALTNPEAENRRDPESMTPEEYDRWYCTAYPSSIAYQIGEALPDAEASVDRGITRATADVLHRLRGILIALATVVLLGTGMGVAAVLTTAVLERRLEAGLLVALGAETWKVAFFFLSEAALLGLAGGLLGGLGGLAAGRLLGQLVFGVAVPMVPALLPLAVTAGVAVALVGALVPVYRVFAARPALTLRRATA